MSFEKSVRRGRVWEDANKLHEILSNKVSFNLTGKKERDFEFSFSSALQINEDIFNGQLITQTNKERKVNSIYCFGKNYRPDITIDDNGIAIEIKYISYHGLKDAIGQGFLYRLQYKFVFLVLIISEEKKEMYQDLAIGKEKDLENTLQFLADEMNIFTYILPSFTIKTIGTKKCYSFFEPLNS